MGKQASSGFEEQLPYCCSDHRVMSTTMSDN